MMGIRSVKSEEDKHNIKLKVEINSDGLDSLNLKLAAAIELAKSLEESMTNVETNVASVSIGFDANGRPYKTITYYNKEDSVAYSPTIAINSYCDGCDIAGHIKAQIEDSQRYFLDKLNRCGKL